MGAGVKGGEGRNRIKVKIAEHEKKDRRLLQQSPDYTERHMRGGQQTRRPCSATSTMRER